MDPDAVVAQMMGRESLFQDIPAAQAWLAERFSDEDDSREPEDVPLLELVQRCYAWGDQAWHVAGKELDRADEANTRLYKAVTRAEYAERHADYLRTRMLVAVSFLGSKYETFVKHVADLDAKQKVES